MESIKPAFRDLESFNARYPDDIPQETYAWYQAMFHQRVADVHKVSGLKFLTMLRTAGLTADVKYAPAADLLKRGSLTSRACVRHCAGSIGRRDCASSARCAARGSAS